MHRASRAVDVDILFARGDHCWQRHHWLYRGGSLHDFNDPARSCNHYGIMYAAELQRRFPTESRRLPRWLTLHSAAGLPGICDFRTGDWLHKFRQRSCHQSGLLQQL
jgi:hypothetical protein